VKQVEFVGAQETHDIGLWAEQPGRRGCLTKEEMKRPRISCKYLDFLWNTHENIKEPELWLTP
jgi:hypothetical protein